MRDSGISPLVKVKNELFGFLMTSSVQNAYYVVQRTVQNKEVVLYRSSQKRTDPEIEFVT